MRLIVGLGICLLWVSTIQAEKLSPKLKSQTDWQNGLHMPNLLLEDFVEGEFPAEALKLKFQHENKTIVLVLDDVSKRYTRPKPTLAMTFVKSESSKDFDFIASGEISKDVDFVEGIEWFKKKQNPKGSALKLIQERIAEALSRNEKQFLWKNKTDAMKALEGFSLKASYEKLKLFKFVRDKGGSLGGIMEFEVFTDSKLKPVATRITNELVID
jgi:hypothetical protein